MNWPNGTGPVMVTLINGGIVFSDAEAWRHETEARMLLSYSDIGRADMLARIQKQRGPEAVDALRATMAQIEGAA